MGQLSKLAKGTSRPSSRFRSMYKVEVGPNSLLTQFPEGGTELNLGTSVRNGIQRVGRIDGIKSRGETTVQETPIPMETEAREPIRSTAKASMDRSVRSETTTRSGIVLGHLFLGLRNVVKTVMETWPRNERLLGHGPLQRTRVNT